MTRNSIEHETKLVSAIVKRVAKKLDFDEDQITIHNTLEGLTINVSRPDLSKWTEAMTPRPEDLKKKVLIDGVIIEKALITLIEASKALSHVHDRFGRDIPIWATAIHPLAKMALASCSYAKQDILEAARSETWKSIEEDEEIQIGYKTGLDVEIKLLRFGSAGTLYRSRGTFASLDLPAVPTSVLLNLAGRPLSDIIKSNEPFYGMMISDVMDRPVIGRTRISVQADLIPFEAPPKGEDPWWISKWSAFHDLVMDRCVSQGDGK